MRLSTHYLVSITPVHRATIKGGPGGHLYCVTLYVPRDFPSSPTSPPLQPCTWACKCAHTHRQKVVSTPQHFSALYIAIPMKTLWRHPCHHNTDASASFRHLSAFLHMFWLLSRPQLFRPIIICYCCPKTPVCYVCFYSVFLFTGVFVSCSVFDRSGSLYIMAISIWVFGVKPFLN